MFCYYNQKKEKQGISAFSQTCHICVNANRMNEKNKNKHKTLSGF